MHKRPYRFEYEVAYVEELDRTVIFRNVYIQDDLIAIQFVQWYSGEPDDYCTKSLIDDVSNISWI